MVVHSVPCADFITSHMRGRALLLLSVYTAHRAVSAGHAQHSAPVALGLMNVGTCYLVLSCADVSLFAAGGRWMPKHAVWFPAARQPEPTCTQMHNCACC